MKIVLTEVPGTAGRDISIEKSCCPPDAELVRVVFDEEESDYTAFYDAIRDADMIVDGYVHFGKKELDVLEKCSVISFQSIGYNEVDLDYATEKGIGVCSLTDYCVPEVAEHTLALMLAAQRRLREFDYSIQTDRKWDYSMASDLHIKRIQGQTYGLTGFERIGRAVAKRAKGFEMHVIAYDPFLPKNAGDELGVEMVSFDELLERSDVISLHMGLNESNYHLYNKDTFSRMKRCPILINEGRGAMIDEEDLIWALDNNLIRIAALDVLESEMPDMTTCPLVGRSDVILTPHVGYYSETSDDLVYRQAMENALAYHRGDYDAVNTIRNPQLIEQR